MANETESVVRVTRYIKRITARDFVTGFPVTYEVPLDWGIGVVDRGEEVIFGSPYQLFSTDMYGSPIADSRVHVVPEVLGASTLTGDPRPVYGDVLHFKQPNI